MKPSTMSYEQRAEMLGFSPLMDTKDLALYIKMHPQTVKVLAEKKIIPGKKTNRGWRFHKHIVDNWLSLKKQSKKRKKVNKA